MADTAVQTGTDVVDRGRTRFAATIVLGHALKHLYLSGLQTVLLPEIKIGLGLSGAQIGAMASAQQVTGWVSTMGSGYVGDRFANKTAFMLGLSLGVTGVAFFFLGFAGSYIALLGGDAPGRPRPVALSPAGDRGAVAPFRGPARLRRFDARHGRQHR